MKVGIDLVDVKRFESKIASASVGFLDRHFSKTELKNKNTNHLAGILAAKEAVFKTGFLGDNIDFSRVVINQNSKGRPVVCDINMRQIECLDVSISHDGNYATAVAVWSNI